MRVWKSAGSLALTVLVCSVFAGCEGPTQTSDLRKENQQLKVVIQNLEEESKDLRSQLDEQASRLEGLRIALSGEQRKVQVLHDGIGSLRGRASLDEKIKIQLEDLARKFGGQLIGRRLQLPGDFFFGSGQYTLRPSAQSGLTQFVKILEKEKLVLLIVGHTDSDRIRNPSLRRKGITTNRHLSLLRSLAVLKQLENNGYPSDKMYCTGWGAQFPIAANSTNRGKAMNRRVEILLDPIANSLFSSQTAIQGVGPVEEANPLPLTP